MKKIFYLFLITVILLNQLTLIGCGQTDEILIFTNGEKIQLSVPPVIINNKTMIPVRDIAEKFGAEVKWNGIKRTVDIIKDGHHITLTIGSDIISKNNQEIVIDVPAVIINDKTMVPLRTVLENVGINVDWFMLDLWYENENKEITKGNKTGIIDTYDNNNRNLSIKECMNIASEKVKKDMPVSQDDITLLEETWAEESLKSHLYEPCLVDLSDDCYLISVVMIDYVVLVSVNKYNGNSKIVCDGAQDYWHGMVDF